MISLGSPAGLVGGAFAPLIGGAHVVWQAPFAALRFVETLDASAPAHLFAPASAVEALGAAGLLTPQRLASLTVVAAEGAKIPAFPHELDLEVCVLRIGAGADFRLEALAGFGGRPGGAGVGRRARRFQSRHERFQGFGRLFLRYWPNILHVYIVI